MGTSAQLEHMPVQSQANVNVQNMTYLTSRGWLHKIKPKAVV
jgi:hypothetical protein